MKFYIHEYNHEMHTHILTDTFDDFEEALTTLNSLNYETCWLNNHLAYTLECVPETEEEADIWS